MVEQSGITLLGLGPGDAGHITRQAWNWLNHIQRVVLRTRQHPCVQHLPAHLEVLSFDDLYENGESFEAVYQEISSRVLHMGAELGGVTYAVPGHPFVAEATGVEIARRAREAGIPLQVIEGLSFFEPVFSALQVDPFPHTALVDALELGRLHTPPFPADQPALIAQIYSRAVASEVKLALEQVYPDEHPVRLVHAAGTSRQVVEDVKLYEIDRSRKTGLMTVLYLPPLESDTSFERFQQVVARLRAPDGCPWDREQTHASLRRHLLEETYEVLNAIDSASAASLSEELGDLLLQIVLHAQIAVEDGEFSMAQVLQGITRKLVRRHPHVFAQTQVNGVQDVLHNWEQIKDQERKHKDQPEQKGLLDGIPLELPALALAMQQSERAARVGFDWDTIAGVWDKVREELGEVQAAGDDAQREEEVGDLLLAVVNLARWMQVDAESALRASNLKFRQRFAYMEQQARLAGKRLQDLSMAEKDALWNAAKQG